MAYITTYTLHKLARSLASSKKSFTKDEFLKHIYNDSRIYFYLNRLEHSYLFNFSQLLIKPIVHFKQVPERRDTGNFVREKDSKLIYHLYKECELLNKDFLGFIIPQEVKEKGLITKYRKWFEYHNFIEKYLEGRINKEAIILSYNTTFCLEHNLKKLNPAYKLIEEKLNSGYLDHEESFDTQKFYKKINEWVYRADQRLPISQWKLLGKWHSFGNKTHKDLELLLDKLEINSSFRNYNSVQVISEVLKEHHLEVNELMRMLRNYFCWTYTIEAKEFDVITLEDFNLKCCSSCRKFTMLKEFDISNVSNDD